MAHQQEEERHYDHLYDKDVKPCTDETGALNFSVMKDEQIKAYITHKHEKQIMIKNTELD